MDGLVQKTTAHSYITPLNWTMTAMELATVANLTFPSDLIGPGMYQDEVLTKPIRYRQGKLDVPTGPGLGVSAMSAA